MKKVLIIITLLILTPIANLALPKSLNKIACPLIFPTNYPLVYVFPETVIADVGETFTVSVIVYNLT